jgi:alpha-beta hydrolase superfamily lysophospholipase
MRNTDNNFACLTRDGISLWLRRFPTGAEPARGAVVLQHGLGSRTLAFDYPGRSLALHLSTAGFDCYLPELRGTGRSQRPARPWGVDDYVEQDIPAIVEAVRADSGQQRIHWIGHSMGGVLMMFYGIEHPDAPIKSLVTIGSSLDYSAGHSVFRKMRRLRWMAGSWLRYLDFGRLARLNALSAGHGPFFPAEEMNVWRYNIERAITRDLLSHGFGLIPFRLFDDLDTTFQQGGFSRQGGRIRYLEQAHAFRLPTCLIAGSKDAQCSVEAVQATARLLENAAEKEVLCMGTDYGQYGEYGHFDLILGRRAETEVWPSILRFIERHA